MESLRAECRETLVQLARKGVEVGIVFVAETEDGVAKAGESERGLFEVIPKDAGIVRRLAISPRADDEQREAVLGEIVRLHFGEIVKLGVPALVERALIGATREGLGIAGHGGVVDGERGGHGGGVSADRIRER